MRVLIAEDDETARMVIESLVSGWGYEPVSVANGHAAWELAKLGASPRLAILDWMMPGMDGIELCRRLKDQQGEGFTYVIMLTAKSTLEDIVTGLNAGADDFLTKPVRSEELRSRLGAGVRILHYQQELAKRNEDLRKIDGQRIRLLDTITHDLRNAMVYMRGLSELLAEGELDTDHVGAILENMKSVGKETLVTLDRFRDLAQIEQGRFRLHIKKSDLRNLIKARVAQLGNKAEEKGVQLKMDIVASAELLFDRYRITQVVDSLLANALHFSPEGSTITVRMQLSKGAIKVGVEDQGPGIAQDKHQYLFTPYLSVEGEQGQRRLGLGLAISKGIIEAHGGKISCQNVPTGGSLFFFSLPTSISLPTSG